MDRNSLKSSAVYYDAQGNHQNDVPFYLDLIGNRNPSVLELGCGTGRVLVPLAAQCEFIHGLDHSEEMLEICRENLVTENISTDRAIVELADIVDFELNQKFDLITAPFRVLQNLESKSEIDGFSDCI
jgi:ubiquinone/menaquinone biosynthesis C-methylase UbiE